jgi:hypothetical protein
MLMFIFKTDKVLAAHFFKIYDVKRVKFTITIAVLCLLLIWSIFNPVTADYMASIQAKYLLHSVDNLFDYTVPLLSTLIVYFVFFNDYKNKTYEFLAFYNKYDFNYIIFYRWIFYVLLFCVGSFIAALFYYRNVSFLDGTSLLLSLRFLPNIFFLSSMFLFITTFTKNNYAGLFTTIAYFTLDLFSAGRLFKIFSMGANANNFYYTFSPTYYLLNRLLISILSIGFVYLACKKSLNVNLRFKLTK